MKRSNDGWIYIVDGGNGLYKIGATTDLEKRLKSLKNMSPIPLSYIHYFRSERMLEVEAGLHSKFRAIRDHGEWFGLSDDLVNQICNIGDFELDDHYDGKRMRFQSWYD